MTSINIATLFGTMLVLAALPSASSMAVSARSATSGFQHGMVTLAGIVTGDITFLIVAVYGLSFLAETTSIFFAIAKYMGGAYLVGLGGVTLWRQKQPADKFQETTEFSFSSSFLTGLLITWGDQKAILFYLGFLPAFLDLSDVTFLETSILVAVSILAIGGGKLAYVLMAGKAGSLIKHSKAKAAIKIIGGITMITVGLIVIIRT